MASAHPVVSAEKQTVTGMMRTPSGSSDALSRPFFIVLRNLFSGRSAFAPGRVPLDPRDIGAACSAVSAAGHEIDVPDLVHTAQVRVVDLKLDDDFFRIELEPALVVERHLGHNETPCERVRSHHPPLGAFEPLAADKQAAVREL